MSIASIAPFNLGGRSFIVWLNGDSSVNRYTLSLTNGAETWNSTLNLDQAPREFDDKAGFQELLLRSLKSQDESSFQYLLTTAGKKHELSIFRLISTEAGPIKQKIWTVTLSATEESSVAIITLLQQCCMKIDVLRNERKKLHINNERLTVENRNLQEYHDKACEAKLLSEEEIISNLAKIQAEIERSLISNKEQIIQHRSIENEREQSPERANQSPEKTNQPSELSGIQAALNHAMETKYTLSSAHRSRKRKTART